ncbi:MAG TPA: hypothetical protein VNZ52_16830 [Candidatus Thermoplasmatota archaeon]|nr:hypothetical protein [Candidatus Thermoplasmatota archaeon]
MRTALLLTACFVAVALAGCTGEPQKTVVDFSGVTEVEDGAETGGFHLHVRVLGLEEGATTPLASAFVGAVIGDSQAIARGRTGSDGGVTLILNRDQEIRLVAQATGWTTEESAPLAIDPVGDAGGSAGCSASGTAGPGGASGSAGCLAMGLTDRPPAIALDGDEGTVTLVLFRSTLNQNITIPVSPRAARASFDEGAGGRSWVAHGVMLAENPDIEQVYLSRLVTARGVLVWTNSATSQADFELGFGCADREPLVRTDGGNVHSYLAQQGTVRVELLWDQPTSNWGSECPRLYVGPIVDAASTQVSPVVELQLSFQGKSRIIPVGY